MPPSGPPQHPGAPQLPGPPHPGMPMPPYPGMPGMRPPMPPGGPMPPSGAPSNPMGGPGYMQPPPPGAPMPHNTLYLNNLSEKEKVESLKKALYHIFSQFGAIIEIHAKKALKLKGQAWIVFETQESAVKARSEMSGFNFYGKPMKVDFARIKSDVISQKDGTFVHRPLRKVVKSKKKKVKKKKEKVKKETGVEGDEATDEVMAGPALPPAMTNNDDTEEVKVKEDTETKPELPAPPPPRPPPQALPPAPPNRILFVENLPEQCNDAMLTMLLQQYDGFKEARLVTGKPGIAFVEFENHVQAGTAKDHLQNFCISPSHPMKLTFARQ